VERIPPGSIHKSAYIVGCGFFITQLIHASLLRRTGFGMQRRNEWKMKSYIFRNQKLQITIYKSVAYFTYRQGKSLLLPCYPEAFF
jgi:hypothetical protein